MKNNQHFGSPLEALLYPTLLLILMWLMYWAECVSGYNLVRWGIQPQHLESWRGIIFMPLLHSTREWAHIFNNSFPFFVLFAALIYYYKEVAWKVLGLAWVGTGLGIWIFAKDDGAFHIGMSGVIYSLFGFLLVSGFFRDYRPLQVISLFVVFLYGSLIWGIFPQQTNVSWEGHLAGFGIGVVLAVIFRKRGPKGPKFQYEIEKELGIEPPDLEGIYNARMEEMERMREEMERQQSGAADMQVVYHIRPSVPELPKEQKRPDDSEAQ